MCYQGAVKRLLLLLPVIATILGALWADERDSPDDTPLALKVPDAFPEPTLPADNGLTAERQALGERLFHDTILSIDGTVSCAA